MLYVKDYYQLRQMITMGNILYRSDSVICLLNILYNDCFETSSEMFETAIGSLPLTFLSLSFFSWINCLQIVSTAILVLFILDQIGSTNLIRQVDFQECWYFIQLLALLEDQEQKQNITSNTKTKCKTNIYLLMGRDR